MDPIDSPNPSSPLLRTANTMGMGLHPGSRFKLLSEVETGRLIDSKVLLQHGGETRRTRRWDDGENLDGLARSGGRQEQQIWIQGAAAPCILAVAYQSVQRPPWIGDFWNA